jgi:hypothetical protein
MPAGEDAGTIPAMGLGQRREQYRYVFFGCRLLVRRRHSSTGSAHLGLACTEQPGPVAVERGFSGEIDGFGAHLGAVAIALGQGLSSLGSVKLWLIFAGGVVGVALTLAPVLAPKYQKHLPSASAFGLAWVFNWYYGLLFFLGALVVLLVERRKPELAKSSLCR